MSAGRPWLLYGANGYTGRLVVAEAVRRGLRPVLAGRDREAVAAIAAPHGLPVRVFALDDPAVVAASLQGIGTVLHCAGPFSATSAPMLAGCLAAGAHYLDITGEIDVFAACHARDREARMAGIVVLPGAGFDVVPTDCVAAMLVRALPSATSLVLAFDAGGGPSPGTARTGVEGLGKGGRVRRDGRVVKVPLAWKTRTFRRDGVDRHAMTIPWGDVYTAHVSTGIQDIEVYMAVPPATAARLRRLRLAGLLLGLAPVQAWLRRQVGRRVRGPSPEQRAASRSTVWGEARDATGRTGALCLDAPNGYELTVTAALGIVERLLAGGALPGFHTPSTLMGPEYVLGLPGVSLRETA